MRASQVLAVSLLCLLATVALGQEKPEPAEPVPWRPPEGTIIINLPSAEVNAPRTLQLHFTHRFSEPLADSTARDLFSFDSGAEVGIGLSYVPVRDLEIGFLRSRRLRDYEFWAKYRFIAASPESPVALSLRVGGDARTENVSLCDQDQHPDFCDHRYSFFAQASGALTLFTRLRLTAVPTFVSYTAQGTTSPLRKNILNVPFAASIAVTRSVNVQAEVVPARARAAPSGGVGWILAIEKTVLRHRFSFTVGNLRPTTVDQYIGADFSGRPGDYFIGFNIIRQWKL
jgi:hypothetical protein